MTVHGKGKATDLKSPVADFAGGKWLCRGPGHIGVLAKGHTLASLFSGLDVRRGNTPEPQGKPLGIFHRNFRSGFVGLHEHLRDYILLDRKSTRLNSSH